MSLWFLVFGDKAKRFIFHDVDFLKISGDRYNFWLSKVWSLDSLGDC